MPARYDRIGTGYRRTRQPDPDVERLIHAALGDARTVVNVGAGAGSYEPADRAVTAVEPSETMIAQRPPSAAPAVQASAEALPFEDDAFDAAMAVLTVHHWSDWARGIAEMRRVARRLVVVTWDPAHEGFWLTNDYVPAILDFDRTIFPPIDALCRAIGSCTVGPIPVSATCRDGFLGAYWARPESYLDPRVTNGTSAFALVPGAEAALERLRTDLASGRWDERYGRLRSEAWCDAGYRLIVGG